MGSLVCRGARAGGLSPFPGSSEALPRPSSVPQRGRQHGAGGAGRRSAAAQHLAQLVPRHRVKRQKATTSPWLSPHQHLPGTSSITQMQNFSLAISTPEQQPQPGGAQNPLPWWG